MPIRTTGAGASAPKIAARGAPKPAHRLRVEVHTQDRDGDALRHDLERHRCRRCREDLWLEPEEVDRGEQQG